MIYNLLFINNAGAAGNTHIHKAILTSMLLNKSVIFQTNRSTLRLFLSPSLNTDKMMHIIRTGNVYSMKNLACA